MKPNVRNLVGIITSLLWLIAGVYMIFRGVDETWRAAGFVVVGVGVVRAFLLARDWKKGQRLPDDR